MRRAASIPAKPVARATAALAASRLGASAGGAASVMAARRSVYLNASTRRLGRPVASKKRNASSRAIASSVAKLWRADSNSFDRPASAGERRLVTSAMAQAASLVRYSA